LRFDPVDTAKQVARVARMNRCLPALLLLSASHAVFVVRAQAAAAPATTAGGAPEYPRVNVSPYYEVDPSWPQRPAQVPCGAVSGLAVDRQSQVWIFTRTNPPVQVFTTDGRFVRAWGEGLFGAPHFLKIDRDGNVWLADAGLHVVRKCAPDGRVLLTLGTAGQAGEGPNLFNQPTDMAIAASGDVFVADGYGNSRVAHFDRRGKFIGAWGSLGTGPGNFSIVHAIGLDSRGRLYVADRNNVRVQVYDQRGRLRDSWGGLIVPWGLWVTERDEVWVCGSSPMAWSTDPARPARLLGVPPKDQMFMRFNRDGKLLQLWAVPKGQDGREQPGDCNWLHCVAADAQDNLYAGDIMGKRAQKFVRKK
jgi:hypothetical protein